MLPFKDQKSANAVRKQLGDLSRKVNVDISPVYTSRKIKDEIKGREDKPPLVNQRYVMYHFKCDVCDVGYVASLLSTILNVISRRTGNDAQLVTYFLSGTANHGNTSGDESLSNDSQFAYFLSLMTGLLN